MNDLSEELYERLSEQGASLLGFADLAPIPAEDRLGLPRSLSIAVALEPAIVRSIHDRPNEDYVAEYGRRNEQLASLGEVAAEVIRAHGHRAQPLPPTGKGVDDATLSTRLPHKTSATRAGLGWIGKTALLVTREYGPAVRFTTVLTDAPLPVGTPVERSLCGNCDECVRLCPSQAATGQLWTVGDARSALFDAFACRRHARGLEESLGLSRGICGRCVAVCPYTLAYLRRAGSTE